MHIIGCGWYDNGSGSDIVMSMMMMMVVVKTGSYDDGQCSWYDHLSDFLDKWVMIMV